MSEAARKTCLFYDHAGLYVHVARALAHGFDRVLYFSEWRDAFSTSKGRLIGDGFEEIERLRDLEDGLADADLVVFPDMGRYALQGYLRSQGFPVWGMGEAEMLEDDKLFFHHWLVSRKELPNAEMWQIEGVEALSEFLRKRNEVFLKTSDRGDFETYHHREWKLSEAWFNDLIAKIGPYKDVVEIIAQAPLEGVEIGYDGYVVDGRYPATAQLGFECKNKGYIARLLPYHDLPDSVIRVCSAVAQWTQAEGYVSRGMFSSEVRLKDRNTGYFIDPTMRFGIPPSACQSAAWTNLADVVWFGANGSLVDFECPYRYLVELELASDWASKHFMAVYWPKEHDGLVTLTRWHRFDDTNYIVPTGSMEGSANVGAAIGMGNTVEEAKQMALDVADSLEGFDVTFDTAAFDKLDAELDKYSKLGFDF
jgi:hypothetical protein